MESPDSNRGQKYIEGYLEKKLDGKWINYWVVIRGSDIFFFREPNTHLRENLVGGLELGIQCVPSSGKSRKDCFEFVVKVDSTGKKHLFRAKSDILRQQWLYAIGLAVQSRPPTPLPGETDFDLSPDSTPAKDYHTIPIIEGSDSQPTHPSVAPGLNDIELQKRITMQKSPMSFSAFYRKRVNKESKKKRKDSQKLDCPQLQGPRPESVGADPPAPADGRVYDDFSTPRPSWYLGKVTRCAAEEYLEHQPPGTFLVRDREIGKVQGAYTLSLRHFERCRHHKIDTTEQGYLIIKGHDHKTFPTLELLVEFFIQSQKKEIQLKPYIPTGSMTQQPDTELDEIGELPSPGRTRGDGCEERIQETRQQLAAMATRNPYENLPSADKGGPAPFPSRRVSAPCIRYENIPEKAPTSPPKKFSVSGCGYENVPSKGPPQLPTRAPPSASGYQNVPPKQTSNTDYKSTTEEINAASSDAPQLPPRKASVPLGYENMEPKQPPIASVDATLETRRSAASNSSPALGYENVPPQAAGGSPPPLPPRVLKTEGYENTAETGAARGGETPPPDLHPRNYQNLPRRTLPRAMTVDGEPPPVSNRPRPPNRANTLPVLPVHNEIH